MADWAASPNEGCGCSVTSVVLKSAFQDYHEEVANNVNVSSAIGTLFANRIISMDDINELDLVQNRVEKCRRLLIFLHRSKSPQTFVQLRLAMVNEPAYGWLVDLIDKRSRRYESHPEEHFAAKNTPFAVRYTDDVGGPYSQKYSDFLTGDTIAVQHRRQQESLLQTAVDGTDHANLFTPPPYDSHGIPDEHVTLVHQRSNVVDRFAGRQAIGLGITLILLGILMLVFHSLISSVTSVLPDFFAFLGSPLTVVAGVVGVAAGRKKTKCSISAFNVMCILTILSGVEQFIFNLIWLAVLASSSGDQPAIPTPAIPSSDAADIMMRCVVVSIAMTTCAIGFIGSAICCSAFCCGCCGDEDS